MVYLPTNWPHKHQRFMLGLNTPFSMGILYGKETSKTIFQLPILTTSSEIWTDFVCPFRFPFKAIRCMHHIRACFCLYLRQTSTYKQLSRIYQYRIITWILWEIHPASWRLRWNNPMPELKVEAWYFFQRFCCCLESWGFPSQHFSSGKLTAETQSHEGGSNQGFSGFQFRVFLSSSPEFSGLFLLEKVQETLPTICEEVLFPQNKMLF